MISLTKTFFFDFSKIPLSNDIVDKQINDWLRKTKIRINNIEYHLGDSYLFVNLYYDMRLKK
ncbi:hypothetical protein [Nitrososphaeria virus YSH_1032793]|uniref:Uncharacterized protein n=1 Tax=Nitrososphaeria virus YSH_1032793 TaxID=3071320 RepID=A0A976YEW0_9CAUD|nr:hypothetical protein QKV91_gp56 [Yangshan Harbor Nitrososphaeria virus]UVF62260.1 hypothetical protein [Nitrososphaeria virus YSH_1032793]